MLGDVASSKNVFTESGRVQWTDVAIVVLRVALGVVMLRMAYMLAFKGGWDAFASIGGIIPAVVQGPFSDIMTNLYGNQVALWLMVLGSGFVGLSLTSGLLVRLGALSGSLLAISFYLAALPPADGWVNTQILYILGFLVVSISGSGYRLGVDKILRRLEERFPFLRYLAG